MKGSTSAGKGSPVTKVRVKVIQHRSSGWFGWSGSSWKKASNKSSAWSAAKEISVTPTSAGSWSTKLKGVTRGSISVRHRATDQASNTSSASVYYKAITR